MCVKFTCCEKLLVLNKKHFPKLKKHRQTTKAPKNCSNNFLDPEYFPPGTPLYLLLLQYKSSSLGQCHCLVCEPNIVACVCDTNSCLFHS